MQKFDNLNVEELYNEMVNLQMNSGIIHNTDPFDCEICFENIKTFDGLMIQTCLHQFCVDCVRNTIINNDEAEIKCPASECEYFIIDREIRWLLTQEEYDKHCEKSLRIAEITAPNSYHCKKPNCASWCLVEDGVNTFMCPQCQSQNCLACQAIHFGLNCKQYQLMLQHSNNDQRSELALDDMVEKSLAMRCTKCKIIIMKRSGCDWLVCPMCKTELCWATKGSRWGSRGRGARRGDISGGCGCTKYRKCHPTCRNCH